MSEVARARAWVAASHAEYHARFAKQEAEERAREDEARAARAIETRRRNDEMICAEYESHGWDIVYNGDGVPVALSTLLAIGWRVVDVMGRKELVHPAALSARSERRTRENYQNEGS
jgi:hypothetical protein